MRQVRDPFATLIDIWRFLGCCMFLYTILVVFHMPGELGFPIAAVCWLLAIPLAIFRRRKVQTNSVSSEPLPYRGAIDCQRCVHLIKAMEHISEYEYRIGTCNITGQEITNMGYPWQCQDFYTGNSE
jgi:hypothetical protein